jgi:hypothetical protein
MEKRASESENGVRDCHRRALEHQIIGQLASDPRGLKLVAFNATSLPNGVSVCFRSRTNLGVTFCSCSTS